MAKKQIAKTSKAPLTLGHMPPKRLLQSSPANYWQLSETITTNAVPVLSHIDPTIPVPREPHWFAEGTVTEVIHEADGDHHIWLTFAGTTKDRLACEITPQQPMAAPPVGAKVRIYGILRYDHQHGWWELHPCDFWELMA